MRTNPKRLVAVPVTVLFSAGLLASCGDEDTVVQDAEEAGPAAEAAILGETVTVQTEVEEVVGPNVFTVGEDETLVVSAGLGETLEEDAEVQVTGTVRSFVLTDVEPALGVSFGDDEASFVVSYEQELAIVADDVTMLSDGEEVVDGAAPAAPAAPVGAVFVAEVDILTDDTDPMQLVGEAVDANTVEVQEVIADEAFFVGPDDGETVMVRLPSFAGEDNPESPFTVEEGDMVSFTGTLQEVDEELLSELALYNPAEELETGEVYVQVDEISNVG